MAGALALLQVFRLPALLGGRSAVARPPRGEPRPIEAVVISAVRAPKTLRIGKGAPMHIYEITLRAEEEGRKAFEVDASRVVGAKEAPPRIGDRAVVYVVGWRRKVVRTEWEPRLALAPPSAAPVEALPSPGMALMIEASARMAEQMARGR